MSSAQLTISIFFGLLVAASLIVSWIFAARARKDAKMALREKDELKILYDQSRKNNYDLEEKINLAQGQERTYKVAYEDWKSKYNLLEEKYLQLKSSPESQISTDATHELSLLQKEITLQEKVNLTLSEKVKELEEQLALSNSRINYGPSSNESKIVADLKSVLDQHLAIISNIIGDEKMEQYTHKIQPVDPLYLIKGIDDEISLKLQSHGIRSFEQIKQVSKKDIKKWIVEFEDIDDKLIESWPFQAEAILNVLAKEKVEG